MYLMHIFYQKGIQDLIITVINPWLIIIFFIAISFDGRSLFMHDFLPFPAPGIMCDLLWSDPQPQLGRAPSKRGVGMQFGPDITTKFLELNKLEYIIRSHEVKSDGYEVAHDGKCITVFSAPNYW